MFMNDYDMLIARRWFDNDADRYPVALSAVKTLDNFRAWVDAHSDGWAYWKPATAAAKRLMALIADAETEARNGGHFDREAGEWTYGDITLDDLKKAYKALRTFETKYNRQTWGNHNTPLDFASLVVPTA